MLGLAVRPPPMRRRRKKRLRVQGFPGAQGLDTLLVPRERIVAVQAMAWGSSIQGPRQKMPLCANGNLKLCSALMDSL